MWIKRLSLLLGTLLAGVTFATPALAGPVVIIGALVGAAVGAGAAAVGLIGASILMGAAVGAAVGAAAGYLLQDGIMSNFDTPTYNGSDLANASAENAGILIDKAGTLEHIPVVYGERLISGTRVFVSSNGDNNKFLYLALVLCEGEVESIGEIFIDDVLSSDSRFSGRLEIQKFTGSDSQGASSLLQEAPGWTSSHRLRGLAYLAMRFEWPKAENQEDADKNPYSGVPRIKAVVKGRKTANAASAGGVTYENETVAYSTNPADHLLDYLRNPRYGRGLANNRIDFTAFSTARSKYAATVTYHKSGVSGPMMTSNAVINTDKTVMANVKTFLSNMRSGMPYVQGKFKLKLLDTGNGTDSQNTTPTIAFAITSNHLLDGINIEGTNTKNHYNQVVLSHPNPGNDWNMTEVTYPLPDSQEDLDLLAEDDGRRLRKTISLQHITDSSLAADLAHIILYRSRNKKIIAFKTTAELHEVEVGDVVSITYDPLGFDAVSYRIQSMKIEPDYTISFSATEHEPAEYVFKQAQFAYIPPKNLNLTNSNVTNTYNSNTINNTTPYNGTVINYPPNSGDKNDPTNLTTTFVKNAWNSSGTFNVDEVILSWTQPTDFYDYDWIYIYVKQPLNNSYTQIDSIRVNATSTTYTELVPAQLSQVYVYGVKYFKPNGIGSAMATVNYTSSGVGSLYSTSGVVQNGVLITS